MRESTQNLRIKRLSRVLWAVVTLAVTTASLSRAQAVAAPKAATTNASKDSIADFGVLVASLSESGGHFDTDNLISNESSYLHVMGALERYGVRGGAYIGVGPDQNFSYIARIHPHIAFLIDVRRDNMLQHLMFKALFANSRNRTEYLALWLGRRAPADVEKWSDKSIDELVAYFDATPSTTATANAARELVIAEVRRMGVKLDNSDYKTIEQFQTEFINAGLSLRFTTKGRPPQPYYPTLRQLLQERDLERKQSSYLASEADFQFVKNLERRNLVVPVVGDLAGTHALKAIGAMMTSRGDVLSALYPSNAEDYVMRDGNFDAYAKSVKALPHNANSVFIRSFFGGGNHPEAVPGYYSTQLLQKVDVFLATVAGQGYYSYRDLALRGYLPLRP